MIAWLCLIWSILAAPFKSDRRLEAENAALRPRTLNSRGSWLEFHYGLYMENLDEVARTVSMPSFDTRSQFLGRIILAAAAATFVASAGSPTLSQAQTPSDPQTNQTRSTGTSGSQLRSTSQIDIADEARLAWSLKKLPPQPHMRELYWRFPDNTPAFFRDSLLQVVARSYYLTRDNLNGSRSQAWTAGGWIAYRSGLIADMFGVHAAFYTSQKLFGPLNEGGSGLLAPVQNPLGVLGQIYGRAQIVDQELRAGRQLVNTPLINPEDSRMVPNTFGGAVLTTLPDQDRSYDYAVGYLWSVKQRDSNDFVQMSDALAGVDVANRGAAFGAIRYRPFSGLSLTVMDYYIGDFVNTGFAQAEYDLRRPKGKPNWMFGANIIDQRSVGADLLTGSSFQTYQASAKVQMVHAGWTVFVAGSITGDGSGIYSPFGSNPNYTNMQQLSFGNAGEKAFGGSVAYDFGYAFGANGLAGLSVGAWYTHGWDALNPATRLAMPNSDEFDVWVQYRPSAGPLKGFRLKTQYANAWQGGYVRGSQPEFRFIIDYTVLVRPPPDQR